MTDLGSVIAVAGWPLARTFMPTLGVALILAWVVMMIRKRKGRSAVRPTAREQLERLRQREQTRDDLQQIMVEIEQMAKRVGAQLDAKAIDLERLLDRAERQAAELRRLRGEPEPKVDSFDVMAEAEVELGDSAAMPADDAAGPEAQTARGTNPGPGEMDSDDPLTRSVYQLADAGLEASDIAGRLNEHVGKVELILALRQT